MPLGENLLKGKRKVEAKPALVSSLLRPAKHLDYFCSCSHGSHSMTATWPPRGIAGRDGTSGSSEVKELAEITQLVHCGTTIKT